MSVNRLQRRALEKKQKKEQKKLNKSPNALAVSKNPTTPQPNSIEQKFNAVANDLNKIYNQNRQVENKLNLLIETMERLGFLGFSDIKETENLYILKEKNKQKRIKNLFLRSPAKRWAQ